MRRSSVGSEEEVGRRFEVMGMSDDIRGAVRRVGGDGSCLIQLNDG
jgi:hypothetical protein